MDAARRSARTGAASTKVKTIAIVTGSSSGRACSSRKTMAMKSRPRPSQGVALRRLLGSIAIGAMSRAMMAWPLPRRRRRGETAHMHRSGGSHGDETIRGRSGDRAECRSRGAAGGRCRADADRADAGQARRRAAAEGDFLFEPKWDGFRAIVFAAPTTSHPEPRPAAARPLLPRAATRRCSRRCRRLRPRRRDRRRRAARPRLRRAAAAPPSGGVAGRRARAWRRRRRSSPSTCSPPAASDRWTLPQARAPRAARAAARRVAAAAAPHAGDARPRRRAQWLAQFEGAGLDGVDRQAGRRAYQPGKRAMLKIKHVRTADCVVAGFRWHKDAAGRASARCCSASTTTPACCITSASRRRSRWRCASELLRRARAAAPATRSTDHPVARLGGGATASATSSACRARRAAGAAARTSLGAAAPERVCEVKYDHLQGDRFRHATTSCAGAPTSRPATAATTSSRWSRRLS